MKSKPIKFNLVINDVAIRNMKDLRKHFNSANLPYFLEWIKNRRLKKWAEDRGLVELASIFQDDDNHQSEIILCQAFIREIFKEANTLDRNRGLEIQRELENLAPYLNFLGQFQLFKNERARLTSLMPEFIKKHMEPFKNYYEHDNKQFLEEGSYVIPVMLDFEPLRELLISNTAIVGAIQNQYIQFQKNDQSSMLLVTAENQTIDQFVMNIKKIASYQDYLYQLRKHEHDWDRLAKLVPVLMKNHLHQFRTNFVSEVKRFLHKGSLVIPVLLIFEEIRNLFNDNPILLNHIKRFLFNQSETRLFQNKIRSMHISKKMTQLQLSRIFEGNPSFKIIIGAIPYEKMPDVQIISSKYFGHGTNRTTYQFHDLNEKLPVVRYLEVRGTFIDFELVYMEVDHP